MLKDNPLPDKPKGRWELDAVVLQDGHVDRITGPRCTIKMREGPHYGLYLIAHTASVLPAGAPVFYDEITRKARLSKDQTS